MKHAFATALIVVCGVLSSSCGSSPTGPTRAGPSFIWVKCEVWTASDLICRATVSCSLYPCAPGTPDDVTASASWTSDDPGVAAVAGAGHIKAVAPGNTIVRARSNYGTGDRTIAVFPGTPPLPTFEIFGTVYEGPVPSSGRIDGATIEVLNGLIAGQKATSGAAPAPLPGFVRFANPGYYRIVGVPPGTFRLRVTKDGYLPQEREVTATALGGPAADFQLQRRETSPAEAVESPAETGHCDGDSAIRRR